MNPISSKASCHLDIPSRMKNVALWYLLALMLKSPKKSLTFAAEISKIHKSQFSRFLKRSSKYAILTLARLVKFMAFNHCSSRNKLLPGAPWTIAIIVDATLQKRSSRHVHNAQKFNHGKGFVLGHQWTNIVLVINDILIPLSPIKFLTKKERERLDLPKETEHQLVCRYIENLDLDSILGDYDDKEIVVLLDAGYDNKKIQNAIIERKWNFVAALKCSRSAKTMAEEKDGYIARSVEDLFWACRKATPWKTVRTLVSSWNGKKRKDFRVRELLGYLAGVKSCVKLVLSEERGPRKGRKHLACSNTTIDVGTIVRAYKKRWLIELFHKDVKSFLGFEDVSCHYFDAVEAHVNWVYCTYILLRILKPNIGSLSGRMKAIESEMNVQPFKELRKTLSQFGGKVAAKSYCSEVIQEVEAA